MGELTTTIKPPVSIEEINLMWDLLENTARKRGLDIQSRNMHVDVNDEVTLHLWYDEPRTNP